MKIIIRYAIVAIIIAAAIVASFSTENLTEKQHREQMAQYKPSEMVEAMFRDSLSSLQSRAVTIRQLLDGGNDEAFVSANSRLLGIGSPSFYVVKGEMNAPRFVNDELKGTVEGVDITIPLRYIFGNTARDASGWFSIDDFRNTPDFNAVSAEMNKYIGKNVTSGTSKKVSSMQSVSFVGAVAVKEKKINSLTVIPYTLK